MLVRRSAFSVLGVLSLCYLMVYLQRMGMAVIAVPLSKDLDLSAAEVGFLGSAFLYSYAAVQFFSGMLADQYGPRRIMAFFFGLASLGGIVFATSSQMEFIALGRGLCGAGMAVVLSCSFVAFSRWFPQESYPRVCAFFFCIGGLGGLLATAPLSWLNMLLGWRGTYLAIGLLCLAATVLILFFVRDYPKTAPKGAASAATARPQTLAAIGDNLKHLGRNRHFWLLLAGNASLPGFYYAFIALWAGPYLYEVYHIDKLAAGSILTMGAMGFVVGNPLVAWLSEKALKSHRLAVLLACPIGAVPVLLLVFFTGTMNVPTLYFLVLCTGIAANAPNAIRYTMSRHLLGTHVVGTVSGIYGCSVFITGGTLQILIGNILEHGKSAGMPIAQAYSWAFAVFIVCIAVNTLVTWMLPETFPGKATVPPADSLAPTTSRS